MEGYVKKKGPKPSCGGPRPGRTNTRVLLSKQRGGTVSPPTGRAMGSTSALPVGKGLACERKALAAGTTTPTATFEALKRQK